MQRSEKCLRLKQGGERAYRSMVAITSSVSKILFLDPPYLRKSTVVNDITLPCLSSGPGDIFLSEHSKQSCHLS